MCYVLCIFTLFTKYFKVMNWTDSYISLRKVHRPLISYFYTYTLRAWYQRACCTHNPPPVCLPLFYRAKFQEFCDKNTNTFLTRTEDFEITLILWSTVEDYTTFYLEGQGPVRNSNARSTGVGFTILSLNSRCKHEQM